MPWGQLCSNKQQSRQLVASFAALSGLIRRKH